MQIWVSKEKQELDQSPRQEVVGPTVDEIAFYERMVAAQGKHMTYLQGRQFVDSKRWNVKPAVQPCS